MIYVLTCQLEPHQAAILPNQLTNALPEQKDGFAQQLQNTVEHEGTLWKREKRQKWGKSKGRIFLNLQMMREWNQCRHQILPQVK